MKQKFTSFDIKILVEDLTTKLSGFRVINVYDINTRTFLIKLSRGEEKQVLLLESGIRLHTTAFQWPKNVMPSGFSMKLRKHLKGRRLEWLRQVGVDRVVDIQFGSKEAAYHVILEMYDKGNVALTDHEYTILNILRPRTGKDDERFHVRQTYNTHNAIQHTGLIQQQRVMEELQAAKEGENFKKILSPILVYGNQLLEHALSMVSLKANARMGKDFIIERDVDKVMEALKIAEDIFTDKHQNGYIIQVEDKTSKKMDDGDDVNSPTLTYSEYHPFLFHQHLKLPHLSFQSFDQAIDEFFSKVESQKQERAVSKMENTVIRKLEVIRGDHFRRIEALSKEQLQDRVKARLIEMNLERVEAAMHIVRSALARQVGWEEMRRGLSEAVTQASLNGDEDQERRVTGLEDIKYLKFESNQITMLLRPSFLNAYDDEEEEEGGDDNDDEVEASLKATLVDIDLSISAYSNACKYYDKKKMAALKENKTTEASSKALKSAERKTYKMLKEVQSVNIINKARKTLWFEKFLWFISSENYVVIGGRDQQQNEFIVKKYLKAGDIYVHADLHGASSVVIKNPSNTPVSPVTLNEAGCMALCYSAAWEAKVVTTCWWVHSHQVSKTAPSGEYLTTGSFMIRGKKNYLLPSLLVYGFGLLFKVDESCIDNHQNERRVRGVDEGGKETGDGEVDKKKEEEEEDGGDDDDDDGGDDDDEEKMEAIEANVDEDFILQAAIMRKKQNHDKKKKLMTSVKLPQNHEVQLSNAEFPDTEITYDFEGVTEDKKGEEDSMKGSKVQPLKRRQKNKLKKIKQKYGDQDDEERAIRIALLNSAGNKMEGKGGKKGKKSSHDNKAYAKSAVNKHIVNQTSVKNVPVVVESVEGKNEKDARTKNEMKKEKVLNEEINLKDGDVKTTVVKDIVVKETVVKEIVVKETVVRFKDEEVVSIPSGREGGGEESGVVDGGLKIEEEQEVEDDDDVENEEEDEVKDESLKNTELLDSLTGCPVENDDILYCLAVCAPYSVLNNYKYKMKMIPGNCKRGKATKTFLSIFLHEKNITAAEKNHLKSLKDMDTSRNMPGKIKAPFVKKR